MERISNSNKFVSSLRIQRDFWIQKISSNKSRTQSCSQQSFFQYNNLQNGNMQTIFSFFSKGNIFQSIAKPEILKDFSSIPSKLISEINKAPDKFTAFISSQNPSSLTKLQKLTLVHQILIHTEEFYREFQDLPLKFRSDDPWLNSCVFIPYSNFIRKVIYSHQMYERVNTINLGWNKLRNNEKTHKHKSLINKNPKEYLNLKLIYYIINIMTQLFETLKHISTLGRYYLGCSRQQIEPFVEMIGFQAVLLYFPLKFIIQEIIADYDYYIVTKEEGQAFKEVLFNQIDVINEQIKQTLLCKYFDLIQKGIKIKLFDVQKQPQFYKTQIQKIIQNGGSKNIEKRQIRRNQMKVLQQKIFGDYRFDNRLFEESITLFTNRKFQEQTTDDYSEKENNSNIANSVQEKNLKKKSKIRKIGQKGKNSCFKIASFLTNSNELCGI